MAAWSGCTTSTVAVIMLHWLLSNTRCLLENLLTSVVSVLHDGAGCTHVSCN